MCRNVVMSLRTSVFPEVPALPSTRIAGWWRGRHGGRHFSTNKHHYLKFKKLCPGTFEGRWGARFARPPAGSQNGARNGTWDCKYFWCHFWEQPGVASGTKLQFIWGSVSGIVSCPVVVPVALQSFNSAAVSIESSYTSILWTAICKAVRYRYTLQCSTHCLVNTVHCEVLIVDCRLNWWIGANIGTKFAKSGWSGFANKGWS